MVSGNGVPYFLRNRGSGLVKNLLTFLMTIAFLSDLAVAATERQVSLSWEELDPLIVNRQMETVLVNGVYVLGKVLKVLPDALEVKAKKSSNPAAFLKGVRRIPRNLLSSITVWWVQGSARFLLLIPTYFAVGLPLARAADSRSISSGGAFMITVGATVAAYFAGRYLGTQRLHIAIIGGEQSKQDNVQLQAALAEL